MLTQVERPGCVRSERVRLRAVEPTDHEALYAAAVDPARGYRWRFRGSTPGPQQFVRDLYAGVLCQLVVEPTTGRPRPAGLVVAYDADLANGTTSLAVLGLGDEVGTGLVLEGTGLFLSYLFATWPLRRVYAEVPGYTYDQFASGLDRYFHEEGRLEDHSFHGGRYWPLHLLTVERGSWSAHAARLGLVVGCEP